MCVGSVIEMVWGWDAGRLMVAVTSCTATKRLPRLMLIVMALADVATEPFGPTASLRVVSGGLVIFRRLPIPLAVLFPGLRVFELHVTFALPRSVAAVHSDGQAVA